MATDLGRVQSGLLKALDLSAVPDGTDLHGLQNWQAYRAVGSPAGLFEVRGGEIRSNDNVAFGMALWDDPAVKWPGQCVRAEVMSGNWPALVPGLCANGALDHSEDTRGLLGNTWEMTERQGADYGEGFPISSGTTPGQPLTNGQYYDLLVASVQNPGVGFHARGGMAFNNGTALTLNDTNTGISTGINDGSDTYPGCYFYQTAGARIRNYRAYRDYRLTVRGLVGTMAFRLYNAAGSPVLDSSAQSGGEAHVNLHLLPWPYTGHIQVFTDTSWATPAALGRFPNGSGNDANLVGGDIFDQVVLGQRPGVLFNWEDDLPDTFPDEWVLHADKDVTADLVQVKIRRAMANPRIEVDTCLITLRDPTGKYVPARTESPLYPNIRDGREGRVVLTQNGVSECRFYGRLREVQTSFPKKTDVDRVQKAILRLEGPLRELIDAKVVIHNPPSGVLVADDGTGVVATLLGLVPDLIPPETWRLEPTDATITDNFLSDGMTLQAALEQCCIIADAGIWTRPHYRIASDEPNFYFYFRPRTSGHATVDHTWRDVDGDFSYIQPLRFTKDQL